MDAAPAAVTETKPNGKAKPPKARINPDKQEAVIKLSALSRDKIDYLVTLVVAAKDASNDLSDAIKEVAKEVGVEASVARSYIVARAGENFENKRRQVLQLALLFEEIKA